MLIFVRDDCNSMSAADIIKPRSLTFKCLWVCSEMGQLFIAQPDPTQMLDLTQSAICQSCFDPTKLNSRSLVSITGFVSKRYGKLYYCISLQNDKEHA